MAVAAYAQRHLGVRDAPQRPPPLWLAVPAAGLVGLLVLRNPLGLGAPRYDRLFDLGIHCSLMLLGSALCIARSQHYRSERLAWLLLGLALLGSGLGDTLEFALWGESAPPVPSVSDIFWLSYYPFAVLGMALLVGSRFPRPEPGRWLEGVQAAMLVAAIGLMAVFYPVLARATGKPVEKVLALAYPILDIVLIGGVLAAFALSGFRPGRSWLVLGIGLAVFSLADAAWAIQLLLGTYNTGVIDAGWPAAHLLIAYAAWMPISRARRVGSHELRTALMPGAVVLMSIAIQVGAVFGLLASGFPAARALVIAAQVILLAKVLSNPRSARRSSRTDPLTGVLNRRALNADLELCARGSAPPAVLLLCELGGLEAVIRTRGRDARDSLLVDLAQALHRVEAAAVYRTEGGEFWLLAPRERQLPAALTTEAAMALAAVPEAPIPSFGAVVVPDEVADGATARVLAESRLSA
jgi:GGDEF domain-containing protein